MVNSVPADKNGISNAIKMIAVLTIVGFLSGGFLTFVYQATETQVEKRSLESLRKAIFVVLPEAVGYKEIRLGKGIVYQGIDKAGRKVGLAFLTEANGFQGRIKIMVGAEQDLKKLIDIDVLENVETPGLGAKINGDDFRQQFRGLFIKKGIKLVRGPKRKHIGARVQAVSGGTITHMGATVYAITGATISSKAVVDSINQRISTLKNRMKERY